MKEIIRKPIIKILVILLVIIFVKSLIMPVQVQAFPNISSWFESGGGIIQKVINAVLNLVLWLADTLLKTMQEIMIGSDKIEKYDNDLRKTTSQILYSPGIIFMDKVAALKVNFFEAKKGDTLKVENYISVLETKEDLEKILKKIKEKEIKATELGEWIYYEDENGKEFDYYGKKEKHKFHISNNDRRGASIPNLSGAGAELYAYVCYELDYDDVFLKPTAEFSKKTLVYNKRDSWYISRVIMDETNKSELFLDEDFLKASPLNEKDKDKEEYKTFEYFVEEVEARYDEGSKKFIYPLIADFWVSKENLYVAFTQKIWNYEDGEDGEDVEYRLNIKYYDISTLNLIETIDEKKVIAGELKEGIASWYYGLMTIALVGLLSVLLYLGIRIILSSSSAQDKAKYKAILKDWLVALCILFVLHFMMAFMLKISSKLIEIVGGTVAEKTLHGGIYDKLISSFRDKAFGYDTNKTVGEFKSTIAEENGFAVMYLAMVIMTFTFTFKYLKRVVFMAFLTLIAPLIALTYPIDKVKDGNAQAFNYWLREYIYNCLIQPVHLLLYTVLISSAFEFAKTNMLYAIVTLAFFVPTEKIIREMFGLKEQNSSVGGIGSFAGGAIMANMIKKIKAKPPKEDGKEGEDGKGPKTSNSGESSSSSGGTGGAGGSNSQPNRLNGIKAVAKKKLGNLDTWKTRGKKFARAGAGAALGAAAGTATLAANIADGDLFSNPSKAMGEIAGGTMAGYHAGNNLAGRGMQGISNTMETYKEGAYGKDEYAKMKANKEFYKSEEFGKWAKDLGISKDELADRTKNFTDNDIRDVETIKKCMSAGVTGEEYKAISEAGIKDPADYARVKGAIGSDPDLSGFNAKDIATGMKVAREVPAEILADEDAFRRYMASKGVSDRGKAIKYKNNIMKFI